MKYKNHKQNAEKIAEDIAKLELKNEEYPANFKDIEIKHGLTKLSTSSYYKWRYRELINEKKKQLRNS